MRTATTLTLVAIGAILAFAVTAEPSFFSFRVAGWVLMLTGVAGATRLSSTSRSEVGAEQAEFTLGLLRA